MPTVEDRTVRLVVPPLDRLLEEGTGDALTTVEYWLDNELPTLADDVNPASRLCPRSINGKAFLQNRDLLATAIFEAIPEYRAWALEVLEPELRSRYRAALPAEFTDEQVDGVVHARLEQPRG